MNYPNTINGWLNLNLTTEQLGAHLASGLLDWEQELTCHEAILYLVPWWQPPQPQQELGPRRCVACEATADSPRAWLCERHYTEMMEAKVAALGIEGANL